MTRARKVKEISFTMPNKVGLLSEVTTAIAKAKVNITAICAYAMENSATFMLTTDSNAKNEESPGTVGCRG
jgi:ACT domain-containing protein